MDQAAVPARCGGDEVERDRKPRFEKDFYDFAELLEHLPVQTVIGFFMEKYPASDAFTVIRSLAWFDDADEEPDPISVDGKTWEHLKQKTRAVVAGIRWGCHGRSGIPRRPNAGGMRQPVVAAPGRGAPECPNFQWVPWDGWSNGVSGKATRSSSSSHLCRGDHQ